jgi:hypothetical protein
MSGDRRSRTAPPWKAALALTVSALVIALIAAVAGVGQLYIVALLLLAVAVCVLPMLPAISRMSTSGAKTGYGYSLPGTALRFMRESRLHEPQRLGRKEPGADERRAN